MSRPALAFTTVCALTLLGACSSTPTTPSPAAAQTAAPATAPGPAVATTPPSASSAVTPVMLAPHRDPASRISRERSVYFDFDDDSVSSKYHDLIELQGKYLQARPAVTTRVEGFADERGGAEYNLALGQRRAESVTRAMSVFGVRPAQMEAVSYGSERPRAPGHDEASWAENRRADIVYRP